MSFIVHRVAKHAARYTDAGGREKCGLCRFFVPPRSCGKVIGPVSPMGWCKHYSRQMVSQFGGSIVTGVPSLSLDFMTPGTLDSRITFTRASTGTYTNASGVIQSAAINAPRWDYDPITRALKGLLLEEARTNVCLYSADFTNAAWNKGALGVVAPVVTGDQTTAPDGTATADRVVFPAISVAGHVTNLYQAIILNPATHMFSVWLRGNVGGEQTYIYTTDGGSTYDGRLLVTLTTQWQRFTVLRSSTVGANWIVSVGVDLRDAGQSSKPAQTIFAWGAQVEQGAFATSYIPVASTATTRARDVCGIPPANMSGWFAPPGGSWFAEYICMTDASANSRRIVAQPADSSLSPLFGDPLKLAQFDRAGLISTANGAPLGTIAKGASTFAAGTGKLCLNGGTVVSGAMPAGYAALATDGIGFLTVASGGSTENMTGTIRRIQYWPRVLSDTEMQQVTT